MAVPKVAYRLDDTSCQETFKANNTCRNPRGFLLQMAHCKEVLVWAHKIAVSVQRGWMVWIINTEAHQ